MHPVLLILAIGLGCLVNHVDSQCYGLHCAGNGMGLTSSLLSYLQLGGGGLGRSGQGQARYYRRYKEKVKQIPKDLPPIQAAIKELEAERREAEEKLGLKEDNGEDEEIYIPRRRRGMFRRRKNSRRNRRMRRRSQRERIALLSQAQQDDGYVDVRQKVDPVKFFSRSNIVG